MFPKRLKSKALKSPLMYSVHLQGILWTSRLCEKWQIQYIYDTILPKSVKNHKKKIDHIHVKSSPLAIKSGGQLNNDSC